MVGRFVGRLVGDGRVTPEDVHRPFEPHCLEQHDASNLPLLKHMWPPKWQLDVDETPAPPPDGIGGMGCGVGFLLGKRVGLDDGRFVTGAGVSKEEVHRPFEPHFFEQHEPSNCPVFKHTYPLTEQVDDDEAPSVLDGMTGCGVGFLVGRFVGVGVTKLLLHRPFEPQNLEQHDVSV